MNLRLTSSASPSGRGKRNLGLAFLAALVGLSTSATSFAQMAVQGTFSVSPSGAATYSIPIQVPPGVAGIEPALAFTFSSQAGNGLLGVGWNLGGLSAISRCPQTKPTDGVMGGVTFTSSDRFCLDGQRLMLTSGTYGANGATYATETESFARVTSYGVAAGGGPAYFLVQNKDGTTSEYGNTTDSQVEVPGKSPLVVKTWALDKTWDRKGNAMSFAYTKDSPNGVFNGSFFPKEVVYTFNTVTGLAATNKVKFNYDFTRGDTSAGFQAGFSNSNRARLTGITTQSGAADVLTYGLTYVQNAGTGRSNITSVTLCTAAGECLPAMGINPATGPVSTTLNVTNSTTGTDTCLSSCGSWQAMDLNGDGKTDFVHLTNIAGVAIIWMSNGDGTFTISTFNNSTDTDLLNGQWQALDVDGDGLTDLVHITTRNRTAAVWRSNGNGTFAISNFTTTNDGCVTGMSFFSLDCGTWQVLDIDGDGLLDMVHLAGTGGAAKIWRSNGDGTFAVSTFSESADTCLDTCGSWQVLDVNGDGLMDLVHLTTNPGDYRVWRSNGNGTFAITQQSTGDGSDLTNGRWQLMDVNGDGLTDLIQLTNNSGDVRVWRSKGDGTFLLSRFSTTLDTDYRSGFFKVVDYNGDGRPDLLHFTGNTGDLRIWKSLGDGTFNISQLATPADTCLTCGTWQGGDVKGDGFFDFVHLANDSGNYFVWNMPRVAITDTPVSITNGVGASVAWATSTLPRILNAGDGSVVASYTMAARSSYPAPTTTLITPLRVVTTSDASNGVGGTRRSVYSYDSARAERNGRGFLGFASMQTVDAATGLAHRTYFRQDFPFTGLVDKAGQSKTAGTWGTNQLSLTQNTYACFMPPTVSSTCTVAPGNRYFAYASQVDTQAWDLDGTALPRSRTLNQNLDVYGNVGKVVSQTLTPSGGATEYSKTVTNTYAPPDIPNWILGRLLRSTVATAGPSVPDPVVPGSGSLPAAPAPILPVSVLMPILNLLLDD